jgi:hypothetical protein
VVPHIWLMRTGVEHGPAFQRATWRRTMADTEHREIAKITATHLGYEDHGIFSADISLDYGGAGQSAGGYNLGGPTGFGIAFIKGILGACGVQTWEEVKGRTVFAILDSPHGKVIGLEHLPTEPGSRFIFAELKAELAAERA